LKEKSDTKEFSMVDLSNTKRNPLAADTEPTDEELSEVMSEALVVALSRKQESDAWMRRKLAEAVNDARARDVASTS
jgi:hypothetical protein